VRPTGALGESGSDADGQDLPAGLDLCIIPLPLLELDLSGAGTAKRTPAPLLHLELQPGWTNGKVGDSWVIETTNS